MKPTGNKILLEPIVEAEPEFKVIGNRVKPFRGTVLKIGKSVEDEDIVEGAVLIYGPNAGTDITIEGKKLLLLREDEIYAIQ